jgi:hypothetical protein
VELVPQSIAATAESCHRRHHVEPGSSTCSATHRPTGSSPPASHQATWACRHLTPRCACRPPRRAAAARANRPGSARHAPARSGRGPLPGSRCRSRSPPGGRRLWDSSRPTSGADLGIDQPVTCGHGHAVTQVRIVGDHRGSVPSLRRTTTVKSAVRAPARGARSPHRRRPARVTRRCSPGCRWSPPEFERVQHAPGHTACDGAAVCGFRHGVGPRGRASPAPVGWSWSPNPAEGRRPTTAPPVRSQRRGRPNTGSLRVRAAGLGQHLERLLARADQLVLLTGDARDLRWRR